jgi:hypothetical protein
MQTHYMFFTSAAGMRSCVLVACALLASLACGMIEKRTGTNVTGTGHAPACPRIVQLPRGVNAVRRDQTILCAITKLDLNRDSFIDNREYENYTVTQLNPVERLAVPDWNHIRECCDCNWDGKINADEIRHATATCLESPFWVDRVHDKVKKRKHAI